MLDCVILDGRLLMPLVVLALLAGAAECATGFCALVWEREELEPGADTVAWAEMLLGLALMALTVAVVATFDTL